MKKIISLLAVLMVLGLAGCMDNPDGSSGKLSSSEAKR